MDSFEKRIEQLKELIQESNHIVFFGGAGVSTESGIPDFRSKDGLYNQYDVNFNKYQPEYLLSHSCLTKNAKVFYEFYRQKLNLKGVKPNVTHEVLAELEKRGKLSAVITQNIDGLHQLAGSKAVYEIHGTVKRNYCSKCKKEYPENVIFESKEDIPRCECGGYIRPDVTLYEENLPSNAWSNAIASLNHADLLIVGGTSLSVYPANTLLLNYMGSHIVLINKEKVNQYIQADLVFNESLGSVFSQIKQNCF